MEHNDNAEAFENDEIESQVQMSLKMLSFPLVVCIDDELKKDTDGFNRFCSWKSFIKIEKQLPFCVLLLLFFCVYFFYSLYSLVVGVNFSFDNA